MAITIPPWLAQLTETINTNRLDNKPEHALLTASNLYIILGFMQLCDMDTDCIARVFY